MKQFKIVNRVTNKLLMSMIELDKLVYKGQDVGEYQKCKEWLKINSNIYTIVLCDNQVIGYINFMPVIDECYKLIKNGQKKDYDIETNDILDFDPDTKQKCLFTSIVIHPEYHQGAVLIILWKGFIKKLKRLKVNIDSIIMDCVSPIGEKCARHCMSGRLITKSKHSKVYEGNIKEEYILK